MSQTQQAQEKQAKPADVKIQVRYLPAAHPFRQSYPRATRLEMVRTDAMAFFGVRDRTERDTYHYYLSFEGTRVTDTAQILEGIVGERRRSAQFELIEEITPGFSR
jgi:hypothetical protein